MTESKNRFEAQAEIRKENHGGYRYCPLCREDMIERECAGRTRLVCNNSACGFVFYHNPTPAAGIIVEQNSEVLLVKRAEPPKVGWWCIPAGFMEFDENPRQTALRELREETSLEVRITTLFDIYSATDDPRTNAVLILYLGEVESGMPVAGDDALEATYFPLDNLPDNIAFEAHRLALNDYRKLLRGTRDEQSGENF